MEIQIWPPVWKGGDSNLEAAGSELEEVTSCDNTKAPVFLMEP